MRTNKWIAFSLALIALLCVVELIVCERALNKYGGAETDNTVSEEQAEPEPTETPLKEPSEKPDAEPVELTITYEYLPLPVGYESVSSVQPIEETDAVSLAKTLWGEFRNSSNYGQCAAVCWCVLNRVDSEKYPNTVIEVVTAPGQFQGYAAGNPVDAGLYAIACDVLARWQMEKICIGDVGRLLPNDYLWFSGNGTVNIFRNAYEGGERIIP